MKKKLFCVLLFVMVTVCAVCCFTACKDKNSAYSSDIAELQMDKKYIYYYDAGKDESEQTYFVFHSNGTGEYKYVYGDYKNYIITFKYTYVDKDKSAVVCFYDSVEYGENDKAHDASTTWTTLLTVSKNVLYSGPCYINEDYLKETIPNFGS